MDFFIPMNNSKVFARSEVLHGWLEIIRPPNLFTIPGDIFAGASFTLIAEDKKYKVFLAIIISLLLYIAGLIFNDYCDRKTDSVERPLRPIPSGRVNPGVALFVSGALMGVALLVSIVGIEGRPSFPEIVSFPDYRVSMFQIIVILIVLILLYNGPARRIPWLGLILMGLCRGFNILLGAAASNGFLNSMVLYGAGIEAFYIASVSSAAYGETGSPPVKVSLRYTGLGSSIDDANDSVFSEDFQGEFIGLTLTIPIGNRSARSAYNKSKIEQRQANMSVKKKELDVVVEARSAVRGVMTNIERVNATRKAKELAQKRLEAEEKKYEVGRSTSLEVLRAQEALFIQEGLAVRAIVDYEISLGNLERAKGTILDTYDIKLEEEAI